MEGQPTKNPKVLRAKNFVVEENIDAIRWPQECSGCGGTVERTENIKLSKRYKTFGLITVDVAGIPYCQSCFKRSRAADRLDNVITVLTLVFGIPLGILMLVGVIQGGTAEPNLFALAVVFVFALALVYGLLWLLVKRPIRFFFKDRFADPFSAWMIEAKKSDGREGLSLVIAIPLKPYADKFAILNGVAA